MRWLPKLKPKRFSYKHRGEVCLNCKHPLDISDRFCPNCAQRNSKKKINLQDLISEFFASFLSYDSKLWQSLKLLFLKPGKLPLAYMDGKRNQFTNPFRFFLSIAIIFFLVASQYIIEDEDINKIEDGISKIGVELDSQTSSSQKDYFNELKDNIANQDMKKEDSAEIISLIEKIESSAAQQEKPNNKKDSVPGKDEGLQKLLKENNYLKYEEAIAKELVKDSFSGWMKFRFHRGLAKIQKSFTGFLNFVIPKIPFFMFFFVPIFSILYSLLFIGSGKRYVDHMVFNFNLSSFLLIVFAVYLIITAYWNVDWLIYVFNLGIFYYTYRAIRNFYQQGRFASFFKSFFIALSFPFSLFIFLTGLTFLSFIFY
jgi:hypothetical protein